MENCYDCSTCIYRKIHFPDMDDYKIYWQKCLCDGKDYEAEAMAEKCYDCSTCRYRYLHFPNMDDFEISMQECLCDGEYYEAEC